jgi:DNA polymerase IV (DinB-like DNA polymerase)
MSATNNENNNHDRRIVLHVDMDSFFASVEVREHSELQGKPVIVGADPKGGSGRGVVSTCSYEARKYGIHSAMPISQAYKLCPDAAFVPVNMKLYAGVSASIMEILKGFAEKFQQVSVDEAYLVPGPEIRNFEEAAIYALRKRTKSIDRKELHAQLELDRINLYLKLPLVIKNLMDSHLSDLKMPGIFYFP